MEKINIAELLKDCPSGMELDCTMYDNCTFDGIEDVGYIEILVKTPSGRIRLTKEGCFTHNDKYAKCVIFPKGKTTWEGFQRPFKDGDIVVSYFGNIHILKNRSTSYINVDFAHNSQGSLCKSLTTSVYAIRLATEAEKAKLFKAIEDNGYKWNAETKTLEKLSPNFREHSDNEPLDIPTMTTEFVKEHGLPCPNGYVFKDDNGNMINTTKIVLEKIKKEYPKTYEECCEVLELEDDEIYINVNITNIEISENKKFGTFIRLIRCRNAYWKIAGKEMGLGKPWEPDWKDFEQLKYCIWVDVGDIILNEGCRCQHILTFPTAEMRDDFYENFKKDIDECKELL